MSLINQMLNDLDARNAGERPVLANEIRALPGAASAGKRLPLLVAGAVLLVVLGAGAGWLQYRGDRASLPAGVASLSPPGLPTVSVPLPPVDESAQRDSEVALEADVRNATRNAAVSVAEARDPALRISSSLSSLPEPAPAPSFAAVAASRPATPSAAREKPDDVPARAAITRQDRIAEPRENAERLYRSAVGTLNQGRIAEATEVLQAALREDPAHLAARQVWIKLLIDARAWDRAQAVLREGLERVPQHWSWALLLSRLQIDRGDADGALKTLERSENAATSNAAYQGAVGAVLHRLGRYAEAETRYAIAVRLDPAAGRWWVGRGMALDSAGKHSDARDAYQRARTSNTLTADLAAFVDQKLR